MSEGRGKRIQPDGLLGERSRVVDIQFSAPLGLPYIDPIGSLVTSSTETRGLHEGLQQDRSVSVARGPILGKAFGHHGKQLRGKVLGAYPGEDEEAGIVDNQREALLSLSIVPADEAVPGGQSSRPLRQSPAGPGPAPRTGPCSAVELRATGCSPDNGNAGCIPSRGRIDLGG